MHSEERAIYVVLILVGATVLTAQLVQGGPVGAFATLAIGMVVTGTVALVRSWLRRPRLPRAQVLR